MNIAKLKELLVSADVSKLEVSTDQEYLRTNDADRQNKQESVD